MTPQYDRELIAEMLLHPMTYSSSCMTNQAKLLREADDADAAGVHTAKREQPAAPGAVDALRRLADEVMHETVEQETDGWRPLAAMRVCYFVGKLREIAAALAQPKPNVGWQPIETAPKDRAILVCGGMWYSDDSMFNEKYPLTGPIIARWYSDKWHVGNGYAHDVEHWAEPAHWTELPAPPAEGVGRKVWFSTGEIDLRGKP